MSNPQNGTSQQDDDFGLPDVRLNPLSAPSRPVETEPVKEPESAKATEPPQRTPPVKPSNADEPPPKSRAVLYILIPVLVLILGWTAYWMFFSGPTAEEKKQNAENILRKNDKPDQSANSGSQPEQTVEPVAPAPGSTQNLSGPTGRFYVIIHSSVDGDLIQDQCQDLNAQGLNCTVIPPFGKWKYHRLAIADFATFDEAQRHADQVKAAYGPGVWAMRY